MSSNQADTLYSISSRFLFDPKLNSIRRTLLDLTYNTTYTNFYSCVLSAWTSLISQLETRHREIHFSLNQNLYIFRFFIRTIQNNYRRRTFGILPGTTRFFIHERDITRLASNTYFFLGRTVFFYLREKHCEISVKHSL